MCQLILFIVVQQHVLRDLLKEIQIEGKFNSQWIVVLAVRTIIIVVNIGVCMYSVDTILLHYAPLFHSTSRYITMATVTIIIT